MLIDNLRRLTRDGRWIPEIDGLRFVAIFSVILFHMLGEITGRFGPVEQRYWWLERALSNGFRGVTLFFVISGMILALPFARCLLLNGKPVSLQKYYMRRVTRLEPPFIVSLMVVTAITGLYHHGLPDGFSPAHVLATVFYQHSLIFGQWSSINGITWSLEVEIQFYLLAPLFMQVYRIRPTVRRRMLLAAVILATGLAQIPFRTSHRFELSILFYLQYFLTGILIADIFVLDLEGIRSSWAWDFAGVAALSMFFWAREDMVWPHVLMPLAYAILSVAALRSYALRRIFANPWVAIIGGMCYSIYLLHYLFMVAVLKVTSRAFLPHAGFLTNYSIQLVLVVVPVMVACAVFYLFVERPCMDQNWPSKLWRRLTGPHQQQIEEALR